MASSRHTLTYVTGNKMKLEEEYLVPEYQGEPDFIIKEKCKAAIKIVRGPIMVEDTCLCFKALSDLPGPYMFDYLTIFQKMGKIVNPKTISTSSWDSCFTPNGFDVSFDEMEKSTKNKVSHRRNALESLEEYFKDEENFKRFTAKINS
ncbi:hypothetical protein MXB_1237 [Myxobolus squamalis]|nr:hypothetical protein MXB_1237 [Myxobolus squamalis]